jgi:hypothetical protein
VNDFDPQRSAASGGFQATGVDRLVPNPGGAIGNQGAAMMSNAADLIGTISLLAALAGEMIRNLDQERGFS